MRDKFSELIKQGVAKFNYTPITKSIPEQDPICKMYNNIFSIPSDTHMSLLDDGTRIITGHMIGTDNWEKFIYMPNWGAVNFKTSGYWSLADFFDKLELCGTIDTLNGDVIYRVEPKDDSKCCPTMGCAYCTHESKIPQPISQLTVDGKIEHIKECFDTEDPAQALNKSHFVKGESWINYNGRIIGLVNNKVIFI